MLRVLLFLVLVGAAAADPIDPDDTTAPDITTTPVPPTDECSCTYDKIWLDIMLLIDSSAAMTEGGLTDLKNYLLTVFSHMSVGQGYEQVSRIGVIMYGDGAELLYDLDKFASTEKLLTEFNPTFTGQPGSNIEQAIRLSSDSFGGSKHRSNAKKVIVIIGSHFDPQTSTDPMSVARKFKDNGGVIITLEYLQPQQPEVPILKDLSTSSCHQLTNRDVELTAPNLLDVFCRVNCFCKDTWYPYTYKYYSDYSKADCRIPSGGCYSLELAHMVSANHSEAERICQAKGAKLPKVEHEEKAIFIYKLVSYPRGIWLGLKWDGNVYRWEDGTELGSYRPFDWEDHDEPCVTQFVLGYPPKLLESALKNYEGRPYAVLWNSFDCDEMEWDVTCQIAPCTTDNYCAVPK